MTSASIRLMELSITLPEPPAPVANYVPFVISGNLVFVSGQISSGPDGLITGKAGQELTVRQAADAARICAVNLLAQVQLACNGDIDRVKRVVRLGAFVSCTAEFPDHPEVVNSASELMVDIFGEQGRHARAAVGVPSLPLDAAVEIDGIFEISGKDEPAS